MIIKVCGLREQDNIKNVASMENVRLIGMIFYPQSPRYVDSKEVAAITTSLGYIGKVGVFVNESFEEIIRICGMYSLDFIQLHGNETAEYLMLLQKIAPSGVKFIKAFPIRAQEDFLQVSGYEGLCEYFLFDTPTSKYGGSGISFDWSILQNYHGSTPFLLSGGIGPDSLKSLSSFRHPQWAGVDLNSRFETAPGQKDSLLLADFIQQFKLIQL
jgi:phosphoribosylanthranilate isomerase